MALDAFQRDFQLTRDGLLPSREKSSIRPMNIQVDYWAGLGYSHYLENPRYNIRAGAMLLKKIQ
jgi:hypothetical protein